MAHHVRGAWLGLVVLLVAHAITMSLAAQHYMFSHDARVVPGSDSVADHSDGRTWRAPALAALAPVARAQRHSHTDAARPPLFVTSESVAALSRAMRAAPGPRGSDAGVDMRDIPMQQVELQPCDPATQDCKELEWVFRIEKPDFTLPVTAPSPADGGVDGSSADASTAPGTPRRVVEVHGAATDSSVDADDAAELPLAGSEDVGMFESVLNWFGTGEGRPSAKAASASDSAPAGTGDAAQRQPLSPPVTDDEFGAQFGKALFVWLGLEHDAFFVNLKPSEPDRVLHPIISSTEVGRVLLEADFFLKNVTSFLLHPDTETGGHFWTSVYEPPPAATCVSFRQWIVPVESIVVETDEHVYVVEAPLDVQEEAEYVSWTGNEAARSSNACNADEQNPEILAIGNQVFRDTILPKVANAVNTAEVFKELRYIFYWRVLAEWFDRMHPHHYRDIQAMDYQAWTVEAGMAYANKVWKIYAESNLNGLYNAQKLIRHEGQLFRRSYSHGEMDFAQVQTVFAKL